ncbi:MAG: TIGR03663 family protein [Bdellovibrionales bacterium]|nr:TIGR03663 family protein [Bdellovibrionales bacterium]
MIIRIVLLVILLAFRFYDLGIRPPHHDEAVNGWFVDGILNRGFYQYDPGNYHGPLFFYFLTLFTKIFGRSVEVLRITPLIFGMLVTATPVLFRKWIGNKGMWAAMFFLAVSPAMVFYSRYAIHEMMFAFACILYFYYWLRLRSEPFNWSIVTGLSVTMGAMACLKENFVMYIASLAIAEVMTQILECDWSFKRAFANIKSQLSSKNFWIGFGSVIGASILMIYIIYSALGRDENGFMNFFRAFAMWGDTGSKGNGHGKPFMYWVDLMTEFEWMAMLGLILAPFCIKKVPSEVRLASIVSVGMWLAYSIVNYKTPWCVLSYYWGLILVSAYWLNKWLESKSKKYAVMACLFAGYSVSAYQSWDAAFVNPDQEGHKYIYGQTFRDFMVPLNEIINEARARPELFANERIQIISTFTWPLPYVLGEFKQAGYYGESNAPEVLDGDVILVDQALESKFVLRLKNPSSYDRLEVRSRQWASPMVIYRKKH